MAKPFYDQREIDFADGANNLVSIVTPVPATYGLSAPIVTSYTALATSFTNLLNLTQAPATRTPVAISNKNAAKRALRTATLQVNDIIRATPTVTNAQLLALRLNERVSREPQPLPSTRPAIRLDSCDGRLAKFTITNTEETGRRGKPKGVAGVYLFTHVGPTPPAPDPELYTFQGTATRMTTQMLFNMSIPAGSTVWVTCCWVNFRGETGILSTPISFKLQGELTTGVVSANGTTTTGTDAPVRIAA